MKEYRLQLTKLDMSAGHVRAHYLTIVMLVCVFPVTGLVNKNGRRLGMMKVINRREE